MTSRGPALLAPDSVPEATVRLLEPFFRAARRYHAYRVEGLEHLPEQGPGLVVFNHSFITYDILLFGAAVYVERGRLIASLADRAIFRAPPLRWMASHLGAVEGKPDTARVLLESGRLVGVAPGGMKEALRPSTQKYQLLWETRRGFARVALETGAPVFLAACPAADDIYTVYDSALTRFVYDHFRLPAPVVLGRGLSLLPRPATLRHLVSEPIHPPRVAGAEPSDGEVAAFHRHLVDRMQRLILDALAR